MQSNLSYENLVFFLLREKILKNIKNKLKLIQIQTKHLHK